MYTREEFEQFRIKSAAEMAADQELQSAALDVLVRADQHSWIHQTSWMGEPILQIPQDMFALQEIIYRTRPQFIIEVGVAWGGSLLFYATLMEILGGERILGIDLYIPDDLRERLYAKGRLTDRITLINGSSLAAATFNQIQDIIGDSREVMVVLDSNHTHEHVLQELRWYAPLIGLGHYLICGDTIIEQLPLQTHRPRPWGPGNNPKTAIDQFLRETDRFEVDKAIEHKLLFTCNPGGYLQCCKE